MHPETAIVLNDDVKELESWAESHQSVFGDRIEETLSKYEVTTTYEGDTVKHNVVVSRKNFDYKFDTPIRVRLEVFEPGWLDIESKCKDENKPIPKRLWKYADDLIVHLGKGSSDPSAYKWIFPEKN